MRSQNDFGDQGPQHGSKTRPKMETEPGNMRFWPALAMFSQPFHIISPNFTKQHVDWITHGS